MIYEPKPDDEITVKDADDANRLKPFSHKENECEYVHRSGKKCTKLATRIHNRKKINRDDMKLCNKHSSIMLSVFPLISQIYYSKPTNQMEKWIDDEKSKAAEDSSKIYLGQDIPDFIKESDLNTQ